ncbi:MAG: S-layer homology domain-containing protein [Clostridia bacterium]|nr:S-layer homology domain-containing protein [Clostridia bacterium]
MKKISYILCIAVLAVCCNIGVYADDAVEADDFFAYEDFNYGAGNKLNACPGALKEDDEKGFSDGWFGFYNSKSELKGFDDVTVTENKSVNIPSNGGISRRMKKAIDLNKDFLYYISAKVSVGNNYTYDQYMNSAKLHLTNDTVKGKGVEQLMFRFMLNDDNTGTCYPEMRIASDKASAENKQIKLKCGKAYRIVIKIEAHKDDADIFVYSIYDETSEKAAELKAEKALNDSFDIISWLQIFKGSNPGEFGDLSVEGYGGDTSAKLVAAQAAIDMADAEFTSESIKAAKEAVEALPVRSGGEAQYEFNAKIAKLEAELENENKLINEIEANIKTASETEITNKEESDKADKAIEAIRESIKGLKRESAKQKYTAEVDKLEKKVVLKKISVLKVRENFEYESDKKANEVAADEQNGWSGGYFADAELKTPLEDSVTFGKEEYSQGTMMYRKMSYPVTADDDNVSYVRWTFSLGSGGNMQIKIGDMTFGADTNAYIGSERASAQLEAEKNYNAVLRLAKDEARLSVYSDKPSVAFDVKVSASADASNGELKIDKADVIGFGGSNCKIYSIEKENIPVNYISAAETALNTAAGNMSETNISELKKTADSLEKCIFKDFASDCAEGFLGVNKSTVPTIRSAGVEGTAFASSSVKAKYVVDDAIGNFDRAHITWHCGGKTAEGKSFSIPSDAVGEKVYFVITVSNKWGKTSEPYTSQSVSVIAQPGSGKVYGGSGGGGISGGGTATKTPEPIPFDNKETVSPFTDIKGHWAQSIIDNLYSKGVVKGVSDTEFRPDDIVTRAEFTALAVNALALEPGNDAVVFSDVSEGDWFASVVKTAASLGIVSGSNGAFRPNDAISREEAAKICCTLIKYIGYDESGTQTKTFSDAADISSWAVDYVDKACAAGIMQGDAEGGFRPLGTATRAESAAIVSRLSALKK